MKIIGNYLGKVGLNLDFYWAYLLGFVMFVMCALFLLLLDARFKFIKWDQMIIPSLLQHIVIVMSGVHLICFFVGLSVDYRLIFYITSAPYMILFLKSNVRSKFIIVFLISVWLVYPVGVLQTIGDFALEIVTAFQLIFILKVFTYNFTQLCKR